MVRTGPAIRARGAALRRSKALTQAELARELAGRALSLRLAAAAELAREPDEGPLRRAYKSFIASIQYDQTEAEFADAFAQTAIYALLTARWLSRGAPGERFTRASALASLPGASPLLTSLFRAALGGDEGGPRGELASRIDEAAHFLGEVDVARVFAAPAEREVADPVLHFYEPFLSAYDGDRKKKGGVFFTPQPVASFVVRSAHELLQKELGLELGLASAESWGDVARRVRGLTLPEGAAEDEPFVRVLDPATGTGIFLVECVRLIERTMKERFRQELGAASWADERVAARWQQYVPTRLLPRLYGYEVMVAPYAAAHLALSRCLAQTGYALRPDDRLHIYRTNTLEPSLSPIDFHGKGAPPREAQEVDAVKASRRFTVVIGNPPYSASSWNKSSWITDLVEDYKRAVRAEESQIQALSNDYIKFIRFGQRVIEQAGVGLLGLITGHGYLHGTQPRDLRRALSSTFERCYCLDLHGSARRAGAEAQSDEPVFPIKTGVAVFMGYRGSGALPGVAAQASLAGTAAAKLRALSEGTMKTLVEPEGFRAPSPPHYLFAAPRAAREALSEYRSFFDLPACFGSGDRQRDKEVYWATGSASQQDGLAMAFTREELAEKMAALGAARSIEELRQRYRVCTTAQWSFAEAREFARSGAWRAYEGQVLYRPFDRRWSVLHKHVYTILRKQVMGGLGASDRDVGLVASRAVSDQDFAHCFVADGPVDKIFLSSKSSTNAYVFPLYSSVDGASGAPRRPNWSRPFMSALAVALSVEERDAPARCAPEPIFDYIYAVLHSPTYRRRYGELLKVDFPRIPLPRGRAVFEALAARGGALVALHRARAPGLDEGAPLFLGAAGARIEAPTYDGGAVWIDRAKTAGFHGVSGDVWGLHVGGYRVCEKWLRDRKGRPLSAVDIEQYQRILVVLRETQGVMADIDRAVEEHGGWPGAFFSGAAPSASGAEGCSHGPATL